MTTADKPRLSRQTMCDRLAMEFQDGWIVNLGVGMPTLCSNYLGVRAGQGDHFSFRKRGDRIWSAGSGRGRRQAPGQRRRPERGCPAWHGHRAPRRFVRDHQEGHGGRDGDGSLRSLRERRLRQLAHSGAQGRRHRRRYGLGRLRQTRIYRHGAQPAQRRSPRAQAMRAANHRARRGQTPGHRPGPVRDHRGWLCAARARPPAGPPKTSRNRPKPS